mgnify:CR=1 FL=1
MRYEDEYRRSVEAPEAFWAEQAKAIHWHVPPHTILQYDEPPFRKWFVGGETNLCYNAVDRHLEERGDQLALVAISTETDTTREITYRELHREVNAFAAVLKRLDVGRGDRVVIYMPNMAEAVFAMLACARIGAIHSVVFGGFSPDSLAGRIADAESSVIVTADEGLRGGKKIPLKANVDAALDKVSAKTVIVVTRTGAAIDMQPGRDFRYEEEAARVHADCPYSEMEAEDPLFILYTSGSTGKPKGALHTTGGYLVYASLTHELVFDYRDGDVYWCTADVGWVTGHSYIVYGPLSNGATAVMYEGAPNWPEPDRFWRIIEKYKVSILYTAPTAIRAFMKWGDEWPKKHDLSSLRLLGSVGEPINPEAWMWYHSVIGGGRCPIVDTWWQTETGSIMISPLPGATPTKPGTATLPFFGILPEVVDDQGRPVPKGSGGKLIVRKPWPSMLRGIWGDPKRFKEVYWSEVKGSYFTGDGCRCDEDGYFWIVGRIDDVLNVAGHRIGTAEIESALVSHPSVAEAAVVGRPDDLKGQALVCFVTLKSGQIATAELKNTLRNHIGKEIGPVAKPDEIRFAEALPKTRSGKIMRRLLKQVASGVEIRGDTTTLEDLSVLAKLSSSED